MEPVGSNSNGRSSRRRMLQMVGAAAAIPAFSSLGQASATLASPAGRRPSARERRSGRADEGSHDAGRRRAATARAEWGTADGPTILFTHGLSQSHLCWVKQYDSTLADEFRLVAYDLRGHGMSDVPLEPEHYTDGKLWADDIAAIIDQLGLVQPVLVGWSYGPFAICDYVRTYGQDRISAINFVEGAVKLGEAAFGTLIGPGFLNHFADPVADDLPTNIKAMRAFVRGFFAEPVADDDLETTLCASMVVPAAIRANLAAREIDCDDVLGALDVPLFVTQGRRDSVVLPRWPNTSSPPVRPPMSPGTKMAGTCPTSRSPSGSTVNWPRSPACPTPKHALRRTPIAGSRVRLPPHD